jgi:transcriptional regulator with XRE-family HTH domain
MNTCDRIKQLFEDNNVTAYEVSVRTHISQSTLSRILNNKTDKLSIKTTDILSDYFSINKGWLVTGKGEKTVAEKKPNDIKSKVTKSNLFVSGSYSERDMERLQSEVDEQKKRILDLAEENRILRRSNENLSESIKILSRVSLIKTEQLKTMSEGAVIKKDMDKTG